MHRYKSLAYLLSTVYYLFNRRNRIKNIFLPAGKGQCRVLSVNIILFNNHISANKHVSVHNAANQCIGIHDSKAKRYYYDNVDNDWKTVWKKFELEASPRHRGGGGAPSFLNIDSIFYTDLHRRSLQGQFLFRRFETIFIRLQTKRYLNINIKRSLHGHLLSPSYEWVTWQMLI